MADDTNLQDQVDAVAQGAASVEFDGVKVQNHPLKDLDEVARKRAADAAVKKPHRGLRLSKFVPPGANG